MQYVLRLGDDLWMQC